MAHDSGAAAHFQHMAQPHLSYFLKMPYQASAVTWVQTSGASVGLIAGAVIAGVAAMLVALALFTTYRRRRSTSRHVYFKSNPAATDRVSG